MTNHHKSKIKYLNKRILFLFLSKKYENTLLDIFHTHQYTLNSF